jgi:hypothetical protein
MDEELKKELVSFLTAVMEDDPDVDIGLWAVKLYRKLT